jgi:hypothetical protein
MNLRDCIEAAAAQVTDAMKQAEETAKPRKSRVALGWATRSSTGTAIVDLVGNNEGWRE